ncbi:MAG: TetR/AcrR family transcriptional regulator [Methyloceanibacter sp.]|uniref:TetR/AcrR family transcriptional regulator n=1 Tax=Methyloceanibacter sp. TaxID=1965321 RepID=UPI003EE1F5F7
MARPREFDTDKALDRAMGVFWLKGYEGASLQDLLKAMKIARGSLYKAFDDKRSIYLAALDRYDRTEVEEGIAFLCDPEAGDGLARIRDMLEDSKNDATRRGCFMCNAAIDRARFDPKVEAKVKAMLRRLEDAIGVALKQSKRGARWSAKRRVATASFILNTYMGLRVLARSGYPPDDLQAIIDAALRDL